LNEALFLTGEFLTQNSTEGLAMEMEIPEALSTLVFFFVFLLVFGLLSVMLGGNRQQKRKIKKRLDRIMTQQEQESAVNLRRQKYLRSLTPFEQRLESLPGMGALRKLIEQSGESYTAYHVAAVCLALSFSILIIMGLVTGYWLLALIVSIPASAFPIYQLAVRRNKEMTLFEEQLPDALDSITRALKVGHPFNDAMRMISLEMNDPIAKEFSITAAEINYGSDFKTAMLNLLARKPSVSLMALVASVLIQRETGGNLSEVISNLSGIIRSRFQLLRKVKTLSAEGRLSAMILLALPFVLMAAIYAINPGYLVPLFYEPLGQKLLMGSALSILLGVVWIRHIITIDF
jgi:tight adherence protein B